MTAAVEAGELVQGLLSTLTGKLIALAAVVGAVTTVWKVLLPPLRMVGERLGRRRWLGRRLQQLACDVQIDYFQHLLGQPAQYVNRSSTTDEIEHVFVFPDAYIQAVTDQYGKVGRFSVTCRSRRFQPKLNYHPGGYPDLITVRLGRTCFVQLGHTPDGVHAWLGARRFGYAESYYFGNPGNYQHYVFALNDAGEDESATEHVAELFPSPGGNEVWLGLFGGSSDVGEWLDQQGVRSFRGATAINTYSVMCAEAAVRSFGDGTGWKSSFGFGPDFDQVRTSPAIVRRRRTLLSRGRPD
jgi:hypothetical protein